MRVVGTLTVVDARTGEQQVCELRAKDDPHAERTGEPGPSRPERVAAETPGARLYRESGGVDAWERLGPTLQAMWEGLARQQGPRGGRGW